MFSDFFAASFIHYVCITYMYVFSIKKLMNLQQMHIDCCVNEFGIGIEFCEF